MTSATAIASDGAWDSATSLVPFGNLVANGNSSEAALYKKLFAYYNNAPNFSKGSQDPYDADTWIFGGQTTNFGHEWILTDRVDFNLSQSDHLFIHTKIDHGVQPTATSFLDPIFNALSPQPSYEGQLSESHTFSPKLTNQFLLAASYYSAIFQNTNAKTLASTVPFVLIPDGYDTPQFEGTTDEANQNCGLKNPNAAWNATSNPCVRYYDWDNNGEQADWIGNTDYAFPQGRNVTGYQFGDDVTWIKGKSTVKFGYAFRRDDITDFTTSEHDYSYGGGENIVLDQTDFAAGYADEYAERFPLRLSEPVALYVEGFYVQDQWKPTQKLTLTVGMRFEHDSNPICLTNCVSNFAEDFSSLPTAEATPYDTLFASGRKQAFFSEQEIGYQPRFGFAYLPSGANSKTTIRGGFGMFNDYFPAQIMGDLIANVPNVDRFTVLGAGYGNPITVDSTETTSGHAQAVASNTALQSLYSKGGYYYNGSCPDTLSIYCATSGVFTRPAATGVEHIVKLPTYEEWSLAIEHQIVRNTTLAVTYIGNRSYHQPVEYQPNAYDPYGTNASLPASRPNAALGNIAQFYSGNWSNFHGLQGVLTSRISWLSLQFNYVYGHALDASSNGGFDAFGVNTNEQINPFKLKQNYGNADYDTRQYLSVNYDLAIPHTVGPKLLMDNWEVAGTIFHNTGYPFSVTDNSGAVIYGVAPLAMQIDNKFDHHCGGGNHTTGYGTACDFASHFTASTDYGQQRRNQLYGPNYTDFDLDVIKGFAIPKWESAKFKIGAQFFNLFNHPNFQIPYADVNSSSNGLLYTQANTPTSILGAFLGGDAAPRLIQFKLSLTF